MNEQASLREGGDKGVVVVGSHSSCLWVRAPVRVVRRTSAFEIAVSGISAFSAKSLFLHRMGCEVQGLLPWGTRLVSNDKAQLWILGSGS